MKFFQLLAVVLFFSLNVNGLNAQTKFKKFHLKKGEILDILLLTNKPDSNTLFKNYKKTVFPVGLEMSYQPLSEFQIAAHTQGNIQPELFLLGKWENLEKRENFLVDIVNKVPDFHEQRQAIWSIFNLTYYEMKDDLSFHIDQDKISVVTAYWQSDKESFKTFKKKLRKKTKKLEGKIVVELENGKSPFGYYYQPDYLIITEWKDKTTFDAFLKENIKMKHKGILHLNQFLLK